MCRGKAGGTTHQTAATSFRVRQGFANASELHPRGAAAFAYQSLGVLGNFDVLVARIGARMAGDEVNGELHAGCRQDDDEEGELATATVPKVAQSIYAQAGSEAAPRYAPTHAQQAQRPERQRQLEIDGQLDWPNAANVVAQYGDAAAVSLLAQALKDLPNA